jgi:hypothetical protein
VSRRAALTGGAAGAALLVEAALPGGPPNAQALSPLDSNTPPNTNTFYPEDPAFAGGAKGDGVTDDTAAIQACISAAVNAGGGTVQFGPKTYLVNGGTNSPPVRHDMGGNAVVAVPFTFTSGSLRIQGVQQATTLKTTLTGQSYSPSWGCPSILGGPTPEQMGTSGGFLLWNVEVADLNISAPANPTLCGLDLSRVVRCNVERVYISTANPTGPQPTSPYSFGLRLPDGLNFGRVAADQVDTYGYYTGIVCNTAHTHVRHTFVKWCLVGYGLTGAGQFDSLDTHATLFELINSEWCFIHVSGWSPTAIISLPSGKPFWLVAQLWDIEDAPAGNWYSTYVHLLDFNNQLYGHATYSRSVANVGIHPGPLVVSGGSNIKLTDLTTAGGVGAATVRPTAPAPSVLPKSALRPDAGVTQPHGPLSAPAWREWERKRAKL